ncbi:MAG: hypothetical protein QOF71_1099 [Candidatus Eremiobacteraeota bacterium]|jgi:hypothetical protein|nr:hypothetical protein [Candidatus Eremiobacteraeota bacterium]
MRSPFVLALALALVVCATASADPGERVSTLDDQRAVGITIYNTDLALVRDRRHVALPQGESRLALRDVSARIQPETALLQSVGNPGRIGVIEQNFNYDLLSPQKLLEKYVGRDVDVYHVDRRTGERRRERARVLATNGGVVLRYADRIETSVDGTLAFPSLPADLRDRPTLVTDVTNAAPGDQDVELTYLTSGLNWKADYTAELTPNDDRIDLRGLITLQNTSGTSYRDASVQLVAGDVNVVRNAFQPPALQLIGAVQSRSSSTPTQQALLEYHLYTLQRHSTVLDNQTKQVELLTAPNVAVTKTLELRGNPYYYRSHSADLGDRLKVSTYLSFLNENGSLGIPLPKGAVRVYKRDNSGTAQFVGSDNIDHTPKGETVRLHLGDSFDVTARKKQTDYKVVSSTEDRYESAYEIVLRNAKPTPQTVLVVEPIPGDWTILQSSAPYVKSSSSTATWSLNVPANGATTLTYRVVVHY